MINTLNLSRDDLVTYDDSDDKTKIELKSEEDRNEETILQQISHVLSDLICFQGRDLDLDDPCPDQKYNKIVAETARQFLVWISSCSKSELQKLSACPTACILLPSHHSREHTTEDFKSACHDEANDHEDLADAYEAFTKQLIFEHWELLTVPPKSNKMCLEIKHLLRSARRRRRDRSHLWSTKTFIEIRDHAAHQLATYPGASLDLVRALSPAAYEDTSATVEYWTDFLNHSNAPDIAGDTALCILGRSLARYALRFEHGKSSLR